MGKARRQQRKRRKIWVAGGQARGLWEGPFLEAAEESSECPRAPAGRNRNHPVECRSGVDYSATLRLPLRDPANLTVAGFDSIPVDWPSDVFHRDDGGWTEEMEGIESHVTQNS